MFAKITILVPKIVILTSNFGLGVLKSFIRIFSEIIIILIFLTFAHIKFLIFEWVTDLPKWTCPQKKSCSIRISFRQFQICVQRRSKPHY